MEKVECPFSVKFVVPQSRLQNIPENSLYFIKSDKYQASTISGLTYFIKIEPRVRKGLRKNHTLISLEVAFNDTKSLSAECKWIVKSAGYKHHSFYAFNNHEVCGPYICFYEDLLKLDNKWIEDGKLTIEASGIFSVHLPVVQVEVRSKNLLLSSLWNRADKDFTLIVGEKDIKVHKLVLANASSVFDQMFKTEWKETTEGKYIIEDFDHETVDAAVQFAYSKAINTTISEAVTLMQFADKYDIVDLKNEMENSLIEKINNVTAVQLSNASVPANAQKLRQKCFEFLLSNFRKTNVSNVDELDEDFKDEFMKKAFTYSIDP